MAGWYKNSRGRQILVDGMPWLYNEYEHCVEGSKQAGTRPSSTVVRAPQPRDYERIKKLRLSSCTPRS
jgi:hypothetical protein